MFQHPDASNTEEDTGFRFRNLMACHDPRDPAEATIVLAALTARNGYKANGSRMQGSTPDHCEWDAGRPASLRELARESGLHIGAVRRGAQHLQKLGDIERRTDGFHVVPAALEARWNDERMVGSGSSPAIRFRISLSREARALGMRAEPLLLTGLIECQSTKGILKLSRQWMAERTGWVVKQGKTAGKPARRLDDIIRAASKAGAIHFWSEPRTWVMCFSVGPSRSKAAEKVPPSLTAKAPKAHRVPATLVLANLQEPHPVPANPPVAHLRKHQDSPMDALLDSPWSTRQRIEGETTRCGHATDENPHETGAHDEANWAETTDPMPTPVDYCSQAFTQPQAVIEQWVVKLSTKNIVQMSEDHAHEVADLLNSIGPPVEAIDRDALQNNRMELARRVIRWCPSPSKLGEWLCCALRHYGVRNLGAYLRRTVDAGGDPGTLLGSHMRNLLGRGAEDVEHFTPATERALEGIHAVDVEKLVVGTARVLASEDDYARNQLREELRRYLATGRHRAAHVVVLKLIDTSRGNPSDEELAGILGDACSVEKARELMAA